MEWFQWENWGVQRKKCSSVSLYNINPRWTILGLHPCLQDEKAPVDSL